MCGIVGAVSTRDVGPILIEGLKRLEYRGYDSAGVSLLNPGEDIQRVRRMGKVKELESAVAEESAGGSLGIAHTRACDYGFIPLVSDVNLNKIRPYKGKFEKKYLKEYGRAQFNRSSQGK